MINDCAYVNQTLASLLMKNDVDVKLQLRTRNLFDKTILLAIKLYFLKADIYHCAYLLQDCWFARKFNKRPLIGHAHGSDIRNIDSKWGKIIKGNLINCDKILVATPDLLNIAKQYNDNVEYFPTPIDINIFSPNIQNKKLNKQKLALYCSKPGDYLESKTNDKLIDQGYKIIQINEFNYPYYKMPDIYHKYDVFIDQHLNPIKSKMCLEAMSCGLPVVTYDGNFLLNGKQNREYIVKYHDANKLITRLLKIYQELIM